MNQYTIWIIFIISIKKTAKQHTETMSWILHCCKYDIAIFIFTHVNLNPSLQNVFIWVTKVHIYKQLPPVFKFKKKMIKNLPIWE